MNFKTYGTSGDQVVLLHGGPGAPGLAALARGLSDSFLVLEPYQRPSGDAPLSVALHVADLDHFLTEHYATSRPVLIGHSWGAMLALAYASAYPDHTQGLVLVGCGTFDSESRNVLQATEKSRLGEETLATVSRLAQEVGDPDVRLARSHELTRHVESWDLAEPEVIAGVDARSNRETWDDMMRLQAEGVYPGAFSAISEPVLMLHGHYDPHPGPMIRDCLREYLPQLEYRGWGECGHLPWLERAVRLDFFEVLKS